MSMQPMPMSMQPMPMSMQPMPMSMQPMPMSMQPMPMSMQPTKRCSMTRTSRSTRSLPSRCHHALLRPTG
ncbi:uncharacterized protein SOCEGT47_071870 [Sorangium cellulosum]|uniref:Uncharacterized protein n=1 Tax=Sorangium cellulosum TaxID=56 RepID=A0A4P2QAC9_SORCE|nr:uncharacterized protein SOCEGT47_071870 [Sorangium cellulosum]